MKKRFISLVAAAALVGGIAVASTPATSQAGTVTVKGDTVLQIYGQIQFETAWSAKTNGLNSNVALDVEKLFNDTSAKAKAWDKTNFNGFDMNGAGTRVGFNLTNKDAGLTGKLEFGSTYLRHAYIKKSFDNGLYLLVGQTNNTFEEHSFDALPNVTLGFNAPPRSPQIAVGGSFDLADSASMDFKFAFLNEDYIGSVNRRSMPTVGLNVGVNVDTGFGAPARIYGNALVESAKITLDDGVTEHAKTSSAYGVGFVLPVSMVTLQSEYIYAKGMDNLAGLAISGYTLPDFNTGSYYVDDNGAIKADKWYAWNLEAKVSPMSCVSVAAGYDYFKLKDTSFNNKTLFINAAVKTSKYTTLNLEWDNIKTKYDNDYKATGNTFYMSYTYSF